jgi:hypothetical protein
MTSLRLCGDAANLNCMRKNSGICMIISVSVKILEGSTSRFILNLLPSLNMMSHLSCPQKR